MAWHVELPRAGAPRRIAPVIAPIVPMPRWRPRGAAACRAALAGAVWMLLALLHPGMAESGREYGADAPRPIVFEGLPFAAALALPGPSAGRAPIAVVVVTHDHLGADTRAEPYAIQLLGAGIAVLDVQQADSGAAMLDLAAHALAADSRFDPARIGLLAFGAGGIRAAETAMPFRALALFYPGCATVAGVLQAGAARNRMATDILLAHGSDDAANPAHACEATASLMRRQGAGVRRVEYAGAGYAWDRPAFGLEGRSLLPRPDGQGRILAVPRPDLTSLSATTVASFFARALRPPAQ